MNINDLKPALKGEITENAPLGKQSWFGCGGSADLLFNPSDEEDLARFLELWPKPEPLTIIGGLANTIIRDGGIRGATIQLGKPFASVTALSHPSSRAPQPSSRDLIAGSSETALDTVVKPRYDAEEEAAYIQASCGSLNGNVAAAAVKAGIGWLEFLSGIPGSLGGALRMNAGAYGSEMKDILLGVRAMDRKGNLHRLTLEDMHMTYRHSGAHADLIFLSAILKGVKEDYKTVKARITEIKKKRNETQPIRDKTGGSTFANPSAQALKLAGLPEGTRAWQIVEKVGGRGMRIGGAQMSEKHCNFMLNTGDATAKDLEMLGDEIKARALHDLGITLRWEIKRIGEEKI